jgi:hypothetical protein
MADGKSSGGSVAARLLGVALVAVLYEKFRPDDMPSLVDAFKSLTGSDGDGDGDGKKDKGATGAGDSAPSPVPRTVPAPPEGVNTAEFDRYMARKRIVDALNGELDGWVQQYMMPACAGEDLSGRRVYVEDEWAEWGARSLEIVVDKSNQRPVHKLSDYAIDMLRNALFTEDELTMPRELRDKVWEDWETFRQGLVSSMVGTFEHGYYVPYTCLDAADGGTRWPWGSKMTLAQLVHNVRANYVAHL